MVVGVAGLALLTLRGGSLECTHADAFTSAPYGGNPACVVVLDDKCGRDIENDAEWMQKVALEMNLSETAFLKKLEDGSFRLRWFTPTVEVDLCGHATLASSHVLWERGITSDDTLRFHTKSGELSATRTDGEIWLDFPDEAPTELAADDPDRALLCEAFGLEPHQLLWIGRNRMDMVAEIPTDALLTLAPGPLVKSIQCRVLSVTCAGPAPYDFSSRAFAHGAGVDEDPVCGSAHCALGPYWASKLGKSDLFARAASARGGDVRVRSLGERVALGGRAVTTMRGELLH
jgi:PhzF family phenazine biosynthesis protein